MNIKERTESPQDAAVRSLALLAQAEAAFPFGSDDFRRALDAARRAIGQWAIGLVNDLDAGRKNPNPGAAS